MGDAGFFKGTSADQDSRFSNKEKKLLKSMSFPPEFEKKVDMKKVKLDVIKPWMTQRITELLGVEDEVVIDFAFGLLEEKDPDPKLMQINLTGFLEKSTQPFILELWKLLLSAQESVSGIPKQFLEQKKQEILKSQQQQAELKARQDAVMDAIRRRKEAERDDLRDTRERGRRSRFDQPRRRSPSPPRRYRSRSRSPRKYHRSDRYRGNRRDDDRSPPRRRSWSRDRNQSPPRRSYRRSSRSSRERRRRSPSTPRKRARGSVSPPPRRRRGSSVSSRSTSRTPPPSRRRDGSRDSRDRPSPPPRTSRWEAGGEQGDPYKKTAQLREQALASLKRRRDTSQEQD